MRSLKTSVLGNTKQSGLILRIHLHGLKILSPKHRDPSWRQPTFQYANIGLWRGMQEVVERSVKLSRFELVLRLYNGCLASTRFSADVN